MTYHKRPMQVRKCAHCHAKFECNHKSRLYCSNSCNTLAWRARHRGTVTKGSAREAGPTDEDLPFSARTVGVVAAGNLVAQASTYAAQQLRQGGTDIELLRADVAAQFAALRADLNLPPAPGPTSFVPAAVRAATGPVRQLTPLGGPHVPYVQVPYHGHTLYYRAAEDVLLWESAPNTYKRIDEARLLAALAATPPQRRPEQALSPSDALSPTPRLNVGPAWNTEVWLAGVQVDQARQAAAMAAFDQALQEGLKGTESGPS